MRKAFETVVVIALAVTVVDKVLFPVYRAVRGVFSGLSDPVDKAEATLEKAQKRSDEAEDQVRELKGENVNKELEEAKIQLAQVVANQAQAAVTRAEKNVEEVKSQKPEKQRIPAQTTS